MDEYPKNTPNLVDCVHFPNPIMSNTSSVSRLQSRKEKWIMDIRLSVLFPLSYSYPHPSFLTLSHTLTSKFLNRYFLTGDGGVLDISVPSTHSCSLRNFYKKPFVHTHALRTFWSSKDYMKTLVVRKNINNFSDLVYSRPPLFRSGFFGQISPDKLYVFDGVQTHFGYVS